MEIANLVREVIRSFAGIKSALPHGVLQAMDAEEIINFVSRRGRLRKIWGTALYYNSGFGVDEIKWIEYFRDRWMAQHGNSIIREVSEGQADFAEIGAMLLGTENRVRSEKWENRLLLTNGVESKFLEYTPQSGEEFLGLGLIPPGNGAKQWDGSGAFQPSIVTSKVANAGSTLADATYGYVVTWWDSEREVESLPNGAQVDEDGLWVSFASSFAADIALAFTGMTNNAVRVDISALKAAGYDTDRISHFIVYRGTQASLTMINAGTTARFTDFKRVADPTDSNQEAELRIANNYYDDRTVEADLGALLDESISPPPSGLYYLGKGIKATDSSSIGPRFIKFFRDQIWMFGGRYPGTTNGTALQPDGVQGRPQNYFPQSGIAYASRANNPDYFFYTYNIGRSTGQKDTGLAKHRNTLLFFKEGSAYYLDGSNPDNYEIRELDTKRGITVPGSIAETTKGVLGLSADGFALFDSIAGGKIISEEFSDFVSRINLDYSDKISAVFDPAEEKYECHVPLDNATYNTHVFTYDLKMEAWEITKRVAGSAAYGISSLKRIKGLHGDPRNGRLYDVSDYSRVTLNGQTMHGKWRSKAFDFDMPGDIKNVQLVEITARALRDFRLSIDLIMDFGQGDAASVTDVDPDVRGDVLAADANDTDGMNYDSGQWSKGSEKKKFTIPIQGIGKSFNLVIRNSDTDADRASFEIEEVIIHASKLPGDDGE